MNFSSAIFIYAFFPLFCLLYLIVGLQASRFTIINKLRLPDILTVFASLLFYTWSGLGNSFYLLGLIFLMYCLGKIIYVCKQPFVGKVSSLLSERNRIYLSLLIVYLGIGLILGSLYLFKYAHFTIKLSTPLVVAHLSFITGISFLSFTAISYLIDVYKGNKSGSLLDVALYFSFFPKVISGPIVLWKDFQNELTNRNVNLDKITRGLSNVIVGLAKKVVIADYFGSVILSIQNQSGLNTDIPTAWLICILYMFQIYYDFSGYSDVALGLSRIIGFEFADNFNFPYLSTSITEFWKRWHISLGNWLKTYLYIPLGGNRLGEKRTLFNILVVMLISGIWHGAGIAYFLWGGMHGICMLFERVLRKRRWFQNIPKPLKWLVTMFIVMIGWEIFRLGTIGKVIEFMKVLFGINLASNVTFTWRYYFSFKVGFMLAVAGIGATTLSRVTETEMFVRYKNHIFSQGLYYFALVSLFIVVLIHIANSTYSPYIYFQY